MGLLTRVGHTGVYWQQEWDTQGFTDNKSGIHKVLLTTRVGHTGVYWPQEWDTQGFADHKSGTHRGLLTTRVGHTGVYRQQEWDTQGFTDNNNSGTHRGLLTTTVEHAGVYWSKRLNTQWGSLTTRPEYVAEFTDHNSGTTQWGGYTDHKSWLWWRKWGTWSWPMPSVEQTGWGAQTNPPSKL